MDEHLERYKGKKLFFLLDTNVYRYIAEMAITRRINGNRFIVHEMCKREVENNCSSIMSLTTTQELLRHLNNEEKAYNVCYDALRFQFFHTQILPPSSYIKKPIPQLDTILTTFFYDTDTKDNRLKISEFIVDTGIKIFNQNIEVSALKNDINAINDDFLCNKKVFFNLFNNLVNRPDNIKDNGVYKRGTENPERIEAIKKGDHIVFIRKHLMERAKYWCCNAVSNEICEEKESEFDFYFKESFLLFEHLFNNLQDSPKSLESLENDKKGRWNAVNDFHLIFEWCFIKYCLRNSEKEIILITDDKSRNNKTLSSYQNESGRNPDVWPMKAYFEFLGFAVEGTNYDNYIVKFKEAVS
jgi:hypothetical protein